MMYTAATAAAVDYQFKKYIANKKSLEARISKRVAEVKSAYSRSNEGMIELKKSSAGKEKPASYASDSSELQPGVKDNPPRAGPADDIRLENNRRRRCLWEKSIDGRIGCSAS